MPNRLNEIIKLKQKTVQQVADAAGFTNDYIYRLKSPNYKERLNEDNVKRLADALDVYPSELLPEDWQKPSDMSIDTTLLTEAIAKFIEHSEINTHQKAAVIALWYEEKAKESSNLTGQVQELNK